MTNKIDYSIHPRNDYLRDKSSKRGDKTNTSKGKGAKNVTAHQTHVTANPKDKASESHLLKRIAA